MPNSAGPISEEIIKLLDEWPHHLFAPCLAPQAVSAEGLGVCRCATLG